MPCQARAEGDQYRCVLCKIVWDRNDPDPPKCPQEKLTIDRLPDDLNKTLAEKIRNETELMRQRFIHHTRKQGLLSWNEAVQLHERMHNVKTLP
jgi:hypothetical protein